MLPLEGFEEAAAEEGEGGESSPPLAAATAAGEEAVLPGKEKVTAQMSKAELEAVRVLGWSNGESKRLGVESPWSQSTSKRQQIGHPPRLSN
jgi:hypothetical protein